MLTRKKERKQEQIQQELDNASSDYPYISSLKNTMYIIQQWKDWNHTDNFERLVWTVCGDY